ncbi:MAG: phage major capsid protein [Candidatus Acidiferrales bacterium]
MNINTRDLTKVNQEAAALTSKADWTKQDERRFAFLQMAAKAIGNGASLAEVEQEQWNNLRRENGIAAATVSPEKRALVNEYNALARGKERRNSNEGVPMTSHIGTYDDLGYFVPTSFFDRIFPAQRAADPLLSNDDVTCINSTNGRPMTIPTIGDVEAVATVVGESSDEGESDITNIGQAVIGAWRFKSPRFVVSNESFQDLDTGITVSNLFEKFASDRLQRGIGKKFMTGSGASEPLGLIGQIAASGVTPITPLGAGQNNGTSASTGSVSIGSQDLANLFFSVNSAYRSSPKCAFLMNDTTYGSLLALTDKVGRNLELVKFVNGQPTIFGKNVKIAPSCPNMAASAQGTVIFGDLSYFMVRIVTEGIGIGVRVFQEAAGLIEQGNIALRAFVRADCAYLYSDPNSDAPINMIQMHS